MDNTMWGSHGGFMFGGFMWIFWIVVIVAAVLAIKFFADQSGRKGPGDSPLEILKKRYARGEIDKEEFERLKKDLED